MKILIMDDRSDLSIFARIFLEEEGHIVVTIKKDQNILKRLREGQVFDLIIENLDTFIENELKPWEQVFAKATASITLSVAKFLKNIRLESRFSRLQLKNRLIYLNKLKLTQYTFPNEKGGLEYIHLFELGCLCPPYDYLKSASIACRKENKLEKFLSSIENRFVSYSKENDRNTLISLLDVLYYKKRESHTFDFKKQCNLKAL